MASTKLTRKEQAAETKNLLFQTALQLLEQVPFEQITIRDIVKQAGVSIGTFYNYYATKLDVYYETYLIADEFFENTVKKEVALISDTLGKLRCYFDNYSRYNCEISGPALTRLLYNVDNHQFDRQTHTGMLPLLTGIIKEGLENGTLHSDLSPEEITEFLMIALRGQVYHWCTHDCSYDLPNKIAAQSELLLKIFL